MIPTFSIPKPSKIYSDLNFGFANKPSGNPAVDKGLAGCDDGDGDEDAAADAIDVADR
jgi:hypothetical protein